MAFGTMVRVTLLLLSVLLSLTQSANTANKVSLTPNTYLNADDKIRFRRLFESALGQRKDIQTLYHGVYGLHLLGEAVPNAADICSFLKLKVTENVEPELIHWSLGVAKYLPSCTATMKLPDATTTKLVSIAEAKVKVSTVAELYNAATALILLGKPADATKVSAALVQVLKTDDGLNSVALAFDLASQLSSAPKSNMDPIMERIEEVIVQADEVDGKMLQFEGGLSLTAQLLSGIYRLTSSNDPKKKSTPPMTPVQALKFTNYLLSRRSVQTVRGAQLLLETLHLVADNQFHRPVCISLATTSVRISKAKPKLQVRVTDVLGKPIGALSVYSDGATRLSDNTVVASKKKFGGISSDSPLYELNVLEGATVPRGFYNMALTVTPTKPDPRFVGLEGATVDFKVVTSVAKGTTATLGIAEEEDPTAKETGIETVKLGTKLQKQLQLDSQQRLVVRLLLKEESGVAFTAQQVFLRLERISDSLKKEEIIFVAEQEGGQEGSYVIDVGLGARAADFAGRSGQYSVHLIVGDALLGNPFDWHLADVDLQFHASAAESSVPKQSAASEMYRPKEEIKHMFRQKEKRPKAAVSNAFTALCIAPLLLLFILWFRLGANIRGIASAGIVWALGFHLGLAAICALFATFWFKLTMFTTLKCLVGVGAVTFLCGNQMLARIAVSRKAHAA